MVILELVLCCPSPLQKMISFKVAVLVLIIKQFADASEVEVETDLLTASGNFIPTFSPYGSAFPADSYNGVGGHGFGGHELLNYGGTGAFVHGGGFGFNNGGQAGYPTQAAYPQPSYANVATVHDQHPHGLGGHASYEREKFHRIIPDNHSRGYNGGHAPNAANGHHHAHGVGGHAHPGLEPRY